MKRLLAVDDNLDSAELVARVGTKCGYESRPISDTRQLSDLLQTWTPDVISLDLCMPEEDGIVVLSTLEQAGFAGHVLIISGQDSWLRQSASRLAAARGLKVSADFSKPLDLAAFRNLLSTL
jgi:two-component system chemotaxis response regulator CheY